MPPDDDTLTIETPVQRRSRMDAPVVHTSQEPAPAAIIDDDAIIVSPEDALAEAHRTITEKDAALVAERQRVTEAETRAREATATAQTVQHQAVGAQVQAADAGITTAKADHQRALAQLKAAKEAGDIDAEVAAQDFLTDARQRFTHFTNEKNRLGSAPKPAAQPQRNGSGFTPAAQAWIDRHPRYNSDRDYRAYCIGMDAEAISAGHALDSPEYFSFIDNALAQKFPEGGDSGGNQGGQQMPAQRQQNGHAASGGGRPNGSSGGGGGGQIYQTGLGPITVRKSRGSDGREIARISIPPGEVRENFEEGARVSGMSLQEYAYEQYVIAEEQRLGGNGGHTTSEGRTYR